MFLMRDFLTLIDTQMTLISKEIFKWTTAALLSVLSLIWSISNIPSKHLKSNVLQLNYMPRMERHAIIMALLNPN